MSKHRNRYIGNTGDSILRTKMLSRMLETGDLARAAIQMWMKDPTAKLVFDKPKDGKVLVQITALIPQREVS